MPTFLVDLSADIMRTRLREALTVYVQAMQYPRGTEDQRASMWLEHTRRTGWKAVAALRTPTTPTDQDHDDPAVLDSAEMLGVAYGYSGAPDQWWQQQVVHGLRRRGTAAARAESLLTDYFELTELHIHPRAQGEGLGEALARRLLAGRTEAHVLLSTPEISGEDNRAWRLYRRLGFDDVIRDYHFAGDPRAFAILGRSLPLDQPHLAR
ncbi:GNAT family N-acetyltransferase [Mycobacterium sp. NPDC003323]